MICRCPATSVNSSATLLDDVAEVSSFCEPGNKPARVPEATMMVLYSRKNCEEPLVEAVEFTTLAFSKLAQVQVHE